MGKRTKTKTAKQNSTNKILAQKSSKVLAPENRSNQRVTRSKSIQTEIVEKENKNPVKIQVKNNSQVNTRSKAPAHTYNTRKTSKNIECIVPNKRSNNCSLQSFDRNQTKETKILSQPNTHFVKLSDFQVNSVVLAKQPYATPWPSRIERIDKNRVFVYFFGDKRFGYVNKTEIYDFILSANAIKSVIAAKSIKYYQAYVTGIAEVQFLLGISSGDSFFN